MGFPPSFPIHARYRHGPNCCDDRGQTSPKQHRRRRNAASRLILAAALALWAGAGVAETLRFATFNADLTRRGPGLLLRDIERGKDPQIDAVVAIIATIQPDVLLLTQVDWDLDGIAIAALADALADAGADYPFYLAPRPNSGMMTDLDLDGDGRLGGPRDAQGFGRFTGEGGMALLSRWPIDDAALINFSELLWRDLPGAKLPEQNGKPFPSKDAQATQRLSSVGHWAAPVTTPDGPVWVAAFYATPPVFDGPEDRNGLRNKDEAALWLRWLDGSLNEPPPQGPLVLMGDANLDPVDGDGVPDALNALLAHDRLRDPAPKSDGGAEAARRQGGANANHSSDPALDTADWSDTSDTGRNAPGNLRVDYVLPSRDLTLLSAGVHWPTSGADLEQAKAASRHRLVWVDVEITR